MVGVGMLTDPASPTRSLLIQQVTVSDTSGICNFRGSKKGELVVFCPPPSGMGPGPELGCLYLPLALGFLH